MSFKLNCGFVLLVVAGVFSRFGLGTRQQSSLRFGDNSLLTCNVALGRDGKLVEERRLRLPFQPAGPGQVWQPVASGFERPFREPLDTFKLMNFLLTAIDFTTDELDFFGTDLGRPRNPPPLARTRLQGSEPFPTTTPPMLIFDELADQDEIDAVTSYVDTIGLGQCDLVAEWVRLGGNNSAYFFPFWYSASLCRNRNMANSCSFPEGLNCDPDFSSPDLAAFVTGLRWDCCNSLSVNRRFLWECGWRRVEIPIIVACACACQPKLN